MSYMPGFETGILFVLGVSRYVEPATPHMPGFGSAILGILVLVGIFAGVASRLGGAAAGSKLVLRQFYVDPSASHNGVAIQIVGRKPGLVAWFLTVMGFSAETSFTM